MRFEAVHPGTVAVWRVQTLVGVAVLLLGLVAVFAPLLAGDALALPALGVWGWRCWCWGPGLVGAGGLVPAPALPSG
ncbi:hypothetical protein ASALC70_00940 [Alcanivorax sp. ALC70]|nr:hypothetical protein ASALC70_00940 [Alcanivorax sp. ALC70]